MATKSIASSLTPFLFCLAMVLPIVVKSQDTLRIIPCDNPAIQRQADSLKQLYERKGFVAVKESSVTMESQYEIPVIVPLKAGTWYEIIFIGEQSSRIYEARMFDWNEKQVVYQKKMWGDVDGNIIDFSYIPNFTEYYMIKFVQTNKKKKKDLCGHLMLLKKTQ